MTRYEENFGMLNLSYGREIGATFPLWCECYCKCQDNKNFLKLYLRL